MLGGLQLHIYHQRSAVDCCSGHICQERTSVVLDRRALVHIILGGLISFWSGIEKRIFSEKFFINLQRTPLLAQYT